MKPKLDVQHLDLSFRQQDALSQFSSGSDVGTEISRILAANPKRSRTGKKRCSFLANTAAALDSDSCQTGAEAERLVFSVMFSCIRVPFLFERILGVAATSPMSSAYSRESRLGPIM